MTREEFDRQWENIDIVQGCSIGYNCSQTDNIVDAYVATLEARIAELEGEVATWQKYPLVVTWSCDSCKHIKITQHRNYEIATCRNEKCNEMYDCDIGDNFCCNYYEPKDSK